MQPDESGLWVFFLQNIEWWFPSKDGLPCRHIWQYMKGFLLVTAVAVLLAFLGSRSGMLLNNYNVQASAPLPIKNDLAQNVIVPRLKNAHIH